MCIKGLVLSCVSRLVVTNPLYKKKLCRKFTYLRSLVPGGGGNTSYWNQTSDRELKQQLTRESQKGGRFDGWWLNSFQFLKVKF